MPDPDRRDASSADCVLTKRLVLSPIAHSDVEELFEIFSDPAGWWYDPASRHTCRATTQSFIARAAKRWAEHGLSYWTARARDGGGVLGVGGAQRHRSGAWNLSWRIATARWGRGLAGELGAAAIAAARARDPDVAMIAWIAPQNAASRRVAERLGLLSQGLMIDANDGQARLAYSDRPLNFSTARPAR
ncbi:MAG: GNAT family N-acetyltransferase [Actinomycetota bacterium]|nr:GNAT family N-acetyltransferase [Actinomycetota bacterium]